MSVVEGDVIAMDTLAPHARHDRRPVSSSSVSHRRDYTLGIGLLLVVVFLWSLSNFLTQDLFKGGYEKPFLVTYLNTSAFTFYLLPFLVKERWNQHSKAGDDDEVRPGREYQPLATDPEREQTVHTPTIFVSHNPSATNCSPPLTIQETANLAWIFCLFWFIANWSVNASLDYTSVASATILSSMSGFFTLGIGRLFHVERLTLAKMAAVLASFGGVLLVSLSDSSQSKPAGRPPFRPQQLVHDEASKPLLGDSLALLSAVFYAVYVILLKVRIRSESRINMQLFFGFVGLFNVLLCWPIGVVLHLTGVESFELPSTGREITAIIINMAITLSSDYLYVISMLKTTPLVVTVGLSLTIPIAVVGDFFLNKPTRGQVILGAILVLISFIVVGVENTNSPEDPVEGDVSNDARRRSTERTDRRM